MGQTRRSQGGTGEWASRPTHPARGPVERPDEAGQRLREITHDLRQPVAAIAALAIAARMNADLPQDVREQLSAIVHEAQRVSTLCGALVAAGWWDTRLRLDEIAREAVESERLVVATEIAFDADPVILSGDAVAWRRVFANLIENGCRAAGRNGEVSVSVAAAPDIVVEVADSGPGFGHGTPGSSGLGMGVVFQVIERHSGHVQIGRSPRLGGAEVRLVIPAGGAGTNGRAETS